MYPSWLMATSPAAKSSPTRKELSSAVVFATSGLGGCGGWVMIHPFNTLAVRWSLAGMQGTTFSFQKMIAQSGWLSLYDGLPAALVRQVVYASARLGLFDIFRDYVHDIRGHTDFSARVVIGAMTGGIAAYIACPMEVATVRMSNDATLPADERRNYKNVGDTMTRIIKEEGVTAFWRGSGAFVQRAMLVGVFQVATMDQFKDMFTSLLGQQKNSYPNVFCAAMTTGFFYSFGTMPLEACKNRMASQKVDPTTGKLPYTSTLQTLRKISAQEGVLALYNGILPYYVRCGGHTISMFILVQLLRDAYSQYAL